MISVRVHTLLAIAAVALQSLSANSVAFAAADQDPEGLSLNIELNKPTYVLGEPIVVRLSVTNNGDRPVTDLWFSYTRTFFLGLKDGGGRSVNMEFLESVKEQSITDWAATLSAGETVTTTFDLLRGSPARTSLCFPKLALNDHHFRGSVAGYVVKPGTYLLVATEDLHTSTELDGGRIRLRTSKEFIVRAPTDEERPALALFERQPYFITPGAGVTIGLTADQSQMEAAAAYEELWAKHRNSPFAPYALYYSARILQERKEYAGALAKYTVLMQEFPQFPLAADALYYQVLALRDAGQREQALQKASILAERYSNHLVSPDVKTSVKGSRVLLLLAELGLQKSK